MRTPFVAGNWKLNKTPDEAEMLARCVVDAVFGYEGAWMWQYVRLLRRWNGFQVWCAVLASGLGAQNMYWEAEGAFYGRGFGPHAVDLRL